MFDILSRIIRIENLIILIFENIFQWNINPIELLEKTKIIELSSFSRISTSHSGKKRKEHK